MQRGDNTESGAPSSVLAVKPADGVEARSADSAVRDFILLHRNTVPYVSQSYSWDCGLACAEMALRARGFEKVRRSPLFATPVAKRRVCERVLFCSSWEDVLAGKAKSSVGFLLLTLGLSALHFCGCSVLFAL